MPFSTFSRIASDAPGFEIVYGVNAPFVIFFTAIKQSDNYTGIKKYRCHRPKPFR